MGNKAYIAFTLLYLVMSKIHFPSELIPKVSVLTTNTLIYKRCATIN